MATITVELTGVESPIALPGGAMLYTGRTATVNDQDPYIQALIGRGLIQQVGGDPGPPGPQPTISYDLIGTGLTDEVTHAAPYILFRFNDDGDLAGIERQGP